MAISGPKDDGYEVSDSTDWLPTPLKALSDVESLLRCQVCKDFFTTPMITSCAHTFCSLCIRRCLQGDSKCPTCRATDSEIRLKKNALVEDLAEAFQRGRPSLLEHARKPLEIERPVSSRKKRQKSDLEAEEEPQEPASKRTRSSRRNASQYSQETVILESDGEDHDYSPEIIDDGLVPCPICEKRMKDSAVDRHIDTCLTEQSLRPNCKATNSAVSKPVMTVSTSASAKARPSPRPDRIAHVNFSTMKDGPLRKKMGELGISTLGTRPLMERRLTEYMTLWNANCDAKNPEPARQLRRALAEWERTQGTTRPTYESAVAAQIKDKDFDGASYQISNKSNFDDLIAKARQNVKRRAPALENEASNPVPPQPENQDLDRPAHADNTLAAKPGHDERDNVGRFSGPASYNQPPPPEPTNEDRPNDASYHESTDETSYQDIQATPLSTTSIDGSTTGNNSLP